MSAKTLALATGLGLSATVFAESQLAPPDCSASIAGAPTCVAGVVTVNLANGSSKYTTDSWKVGSHSSSIDGVEAVANQIRYDMNAARCNVQGEAILTLDGETSCSASFSYTDDDAPSFSGSLPDSVVNAELGDLPSIVQLSATDSCSKQSIDVVFNEASDASGNVVRTWTARDACGNKAVHSQTIYVTDTTKPTIKNVDGDTTVDCDQIPNPCNPTATDESAKNGVPVTLEETISNKDCEHTYTLTRTWTAKDASGNVATASQVISVKDDKAPVISGVPGNVDASCDSVPAAPSNVSAEDNCDDNVAVTLSTTKSSESLPYTLIRTWTATDVCGNKSSLSQTVNVSDSVPPVIVGVDSDVPSANCQAVPPPCVASASDNCDANIPLAFSEVKVNEDCDHQYQLIRTWSATDSSGNKSEESQTLTVSDGDAPKFSNVPPSPISTQCEAPELNPTAKDDCAGDVTPIKTVAPAGDDSEKWTWTATDACGNSDSVSTIVTVKDTTAPVLYGLPFTPVSASCSNIPEIASVDAVDNCCENVEVVPTEDRADGSCDDQYTLTRTWTATDCNGNTAQSNQVIEVYDVTGPVCDPVNDYTFPCGTAVPAAKSISCEDACSGAVTPLVSSVDLDVCTGGATYSYSATDDCGNETPLSYTVSSSDTQKPVIHDVPADAEYKCDDTIPGAATLRYTDDCNLDDTVEAEETTDNTCPHGGTITRKWTVTDGCGKTTTATQVVTFEDTLPPVFDDDFIASDNCDPNPSVTEVTSIEDAPCYSTTVTTYTAVDACGNEAIPAKDSSTVYDLTPPTLTCTDNCGGQFECDETEPAPTVTSSGGETVTCTPKTTTGCGGASVVTYECSADDGCGNIGKLTVTNNFSDSTAPELEGVPADATIDCNDDAPTVFNVTAKDNCAEVAATQSPPSITNSTYLQTTTITWTATDDCGNSVKDSATWTQEDTTPPQVTCPADVSIKCDDVDPKSSPSASDDCDSLLVPAFTEDTIEGPCDHTHQIVRTWVYTDDAGNEGAVCTQTTSISDDEAPTLEITLEDKTVDCAATHAPVDCKEDENTGTVVCFKDNCDSSLTVSFSQVKTDEGPEGSKIHKTETRTYTAVDDCGHKTEGSHTITYEDTTDPVITGPESTTVACPASPDFGDIAVYDDCSTPVTTFSDTDSPGDCTERFVKTRNWAVTDMVGNFATFVQSITISDDENISVSVTNVPDAEYTWSNGISFPSPTVTADHPCDTVSVVMSETKTPGCSDEDYIMEWDFAISTSGGCHSDSKHFETKIVDRTPCAVSDLPTVTIDCSEDAANVPVPSDAEVSPGDCAASVTMSTGATQGDSCGKTTVRTFTVKDACGNPSTTTQTIVTKDTTGPVITPDADYTRQCHEQTSISSTADDDCSAVVGPSTSSEGTAVDANGNLIAEFYSFAAADACGNDADGAVATVTVVDTEDPKITADADTTINHGTDPDACEGLFSASDNCVFTDSCSQTGSVTCEGGEYVNTFTAVDAYGNSATTTNTITVKANKQPILEGSFDDYTTTVSTINSSEGAHASSPHTVPAWQTVTYTDPDAKDAGKPIIPGESFINDDAGDGNAFVIIRTWTLVTDCHTVTEDQTITVTDDVPPLIEGVPPGAAYDCSKVDEIPALVAKTTAAVEAWLADGNNGKQDWSLTLPLVDPVKVDGDCDSEYSLTYTWTASDAAGNTLSADMVVTVTDTTNPTITITGPDANNYECDGPADPTAATEDDCGTASLTLSTSQTQPSLPYTKTWAFTSTDECGNKHSDSVSASVADTTPPNFTGPPDSTATAQCTYTPPTVTADDDCSDATVTGPVGSNFAKSCDGTTYTLTWTATDSYGNKATVSQDVTISHSTEITWTTSPLPGDVHQDGCDYAATPAKPEATAACGAVILVSHSSSDGKDGRTHTWTASGPDASCYTDLVHAAEYTKEDTTPPVATAPDDATDECTARDKEQVTFTDNCDADFDVDETRESSTESCPTIITRTWTGTDAAGNKETVTSQLTVDDTFPPKFTHTTFPLPNYELEACGNLQAWATPNAEDDCDANPGHVWDTTNVGDSCKKTYTRTHTATDACGNTATTTQTQTLTDTTPPAVTFTPSTIGECPAAASQPNYSVTDCNETTEATIEATESAEECATVTTYTTVVTDVCGNKFSFEQTATIKDTKKPTISQEDDVDTNDCEEPAHVAPTANDDCDGSIMPTVTFSQTGTCPYERRYTYTATDACGHFATSEVDVKWGDNEDPVFSAFVDKTNQCRYEAWDTPHATDTCTELADLDFQFTESTQFAYTNATCKGQKTRHHTVTDECGNKASADQTQYIVDTEAPVWCVESVPKRQEFNCTVGPILKPCAHDECWGEVEVKGANGDELELGDNELRKYERVFSAADPCGNGISWAATIVVVDEEAPKITVREGRHFDWCDTYTAPAPTATDNCDFVTPVVSAVEETGCGGSLTTKITYTIEVTDVYGHKATTVVVDTFSDTAAPGIGQVSDATYECADKSTPPVAQDDCIAKSGAVAVSTTTTGGDTVGDCADTVLVHTYSVQDACGNGDSVSRTVTIKDTKAPVLTGPIGGGANNFPYDCKDTMDWPTYTALDACSGAITPVESDAAPMDLGDCATGYTRTYTATDDCGLVSTADHDFIMSDTTGPTLDGEGPSDSTSQCALPEVATVTFSDDCNAVSTEYSSEPYEVTKGDITYTGEIRTWTATDACQLSNFHTQTVVAADTTDPTITVDRDSVTVGCDEVPALYDGIARGDDNCGIESVFCTETKTQDHADEDCFQYHLTRTCIAMDTSGNTAKDTHVVTVKDETAPTFENAPAHDNVYYCDIAEAPAPDAIDDCNGFVTVNRQADSKFGETCPNAYSLVRSWEASDACGNSASVEQTVTVTDAVPPTLSHYAEDAQVECDSIPSVCAVKTTPDCNGASDGEVQYTEVVSTDGATYTRTWTATDACGNKVEHSQTITSVDSTPPSLSRTMQAVVEVECDCDTLPGAVTISAIDNCDADVKVAFTELKVNGSGAILYSLERTWTAQDNAGNKASTSQVIQVVDKVAPEIVPSPESTVEVECDALGDNNSYLFRDNCDDDVAYSVDEGSITSAFSSDSCGSRTVTWTGTDNSGNTKTAVQVQTINDSSAPALVSNVRLCATSETATSFDLSDFVFEDNCDSSPSAKFFACNSTDTTEVSCDRQDSQFSVPAGASAGSSFDIYIQTQDACENFAMHKRTVEVQDFC